jgi:hypothetical protein
MAQREWTADHDQWQRNLLATAKSTDTEGLLESLAHQFAYEAFATRLLAHQKKRKADREAAEVRAKTLDLCALQAEALLGRVVIV